MILLAIGPAVLLIIPVGAAIAVGALLVRKKKGTTEPGKTEPGKKLPPRPTPGGRVVPPATPEPFFVVADDATGVVDLKVNSAFELYNWATEVAVENGVTDTTNAEDALRSLAASLPGGRGAELTQVTFVELGMIQPILWVDILSDAAPLSYAQMLEKVQQGMQDRGLA